MTDPATAAPPPALIEAQGLCKYYGDFTAIENIAFAVPQGSVTAFLGPNGAGKSTTMKVLTGYLVAERRAPRASPASTSMQDRVRGVAPEARLPAGERPAVSGDDGAASLLTLLR